MTRAIEGVIPVLQTPFTEEDQIDWDGLAREIEYAIATGADGICAAMVSEWLRLTSDEKRQFMRTMTNVADGRVAVVVSVGAESTLEAVRYACAAEEAGCDAAMAIPPVSLAVPEPELESYFRDIARATSLPLIMQDASSYVGSAFSIELMTRLLDEFGPDKILFKPEAAPLGPNLSALRDATGGTAQIFDGSGGILLIDAFRRGIRGTIPAVDLLDGVVALWKTLRANDEQRAYEIYFPLCAIVALQMQAGLDGFLAIEKHILVRRGIFASERRRQPIAWELDRETKSEVARLLDQLQTVLSESIN